MKRALLLLGSAAILVASAVTASATPIVSGDSAPSSYPIEARGRNGNTGFEGILFTPGADPSMNPAGAPVWVYGLSYTFVLQYQALTGTSTWSIDFSRDGDYLDSQESVSVTWAGLAGKTFGYVNLYGTGQGGKDVTVSSFSINGTPFGPFATTSTSSPLTESVISQLFEDTTGQFGTGDITASGTFSFSGGYSQERPRVWVQLGAVQDVKATVPDGGLSVTLLGGVLVGLGALRRGFRA